MNTRLKQFLAAENITQAQFADNINVVRASVSHILSGRNKPSFDFIMAMMSKYPNLNIEWLIFGKGRMYKNMQDSEPEQLFPTESFVPAAPEDNLSFRRTEEIEHVAEEVETIRSSNELNTLGNNIQNTVKQRNVSKIIVMFDDGSYQEL